jgi:Peptidase family M28
MMMRGKAGTIVATLLLGLAGRSFCLTSAEIEAGVARAGTGAKATTRRLASKHLDGRDNGTVGSLRAQRFIVDRLKRLGPGLNTAATGFDAYRQVFVQSGREGANLLAVIRGSELPDEYVMLGGHYDHFGSHSDAQGSCSSSFPAGGVICGGATDNAAGTAVVLAVARAIRKLPGPPRRSVVVALWDAEEDGLLGSLYYVNHPLIPLSATKAYLNFDIQGSNLLPSLSHSTFAVGAETGGSALQAFVDAADTAETAVDVLPVSYIFGQGRSDYANFVPKGVPTVFFGDSSNGCYHTVADDISVVNKEKLSAQGRIGYRVALQLTEAATTPSFQTGLPLTSFGDAVSLDAVFTGGLADLELLTPADQVIVQASQASIAAIVAAGPGSYGSGAGGTLISAAAQGIDAVIRAGCLKIR